MKNNTKTSPTSRYKMFFNGDDNHWYIHDHKHGDVIQISSNRAETKHTLENLLNGSGFGDDKIPNFFHKKA